MAKGFILNADDFGLSLYHNSAVFDGYKKGILTSATICANGEAFEDAVLNIIPQCPNLGLGVHLNIMEGQSLTECPLLTDKDGFFNRNYLYLILKQNDKNFQTQVENEFRAQIEKVLKSGVKIDHFDSHVHTHAIPAIFEITCKLAGEFGIKYIRTQRELLYIASFSDIGAKYLINLVKIALLKFFTGINVKRINNMNLKTNDYIIGVGYTGMMSVISIIAGAKKIPDGKTVEVLIHPCKYENQTSDYHSMEYLIFADCNFVERITNLGFEFKNYSNLS